MITPMPKKAFPNAVYINRKRIELIQYLGIPADVVNRIVRPDLTLGQICQAVKDYYGS